MNPFFWKKDVPECGTCLGTVNLMGVHVCDCRGSIGQICRNCLCTLLDNANRANPGEQPRCRTCLAPYRNYRRVPGQRYITFREFVEQNDGFTFETIFGTFSCEAIVILVVTLLFWFFPFENPMIQGIATGTYAMVWVICVLFSFQFCVFIYDDYQRYLNRPQVLYVEPAITGQEPPIDALEDHPHND